MSLIVISHCSTKIGTKIFNLKSRTSTSSFRDRGAHKGEIIEKNSIKLVALKSFYRLSDLFISTQDKSFYP